MLCNNSQSNSKYHLVNEDEVAHKWDLTKRFHWKSKTIEWNYFNNKKKTFENDRHMCFIIDWSSFKQTEVIIIMLIIQSLWLILRTWVSFSFRFLNVLGFGL